MGESLEELERRYFMLQMVDRWNEDDHRYAENLRRKIREKREELAKEEKN